MRIILRESLYYNEDFKIDTIYNVEETVICAGPQDNECSENCDGKVFVCDTPWLRSSVCARDCIVLEEENL